MSCALAHLLPHFTKRLNPRSIHILIPQPRVLPRSLRIVRLAHQRILQVNHTVSKRSPISPPHPTKAEYAFLSSCDSNHRIPCHPRLPLYCRRRVVAYDLSPIHRLILPHNPLLVTPWLSMLILSPIPLHGLETRGIDIVV